MFSIRRCFLFGFISTIFLLISAFYLEYMKGLAPCPLCQLQRVTLVLLGFTYFAGALYKKPSLGAKISGFLSLFFAGVGIVLATRHVWLQSLPAEQVPNCVAGFDYLLNTLPITEVFKVILNGSELCTQVNWRFLGFSIPAWTLVWFIGFAVLGMVQIFRLDNEKG